MNATPSSTPSTPGSQALANLKHLELSTNFKKPSIPNKGKPKILTEEKYIEELSKIIQRDFFPDLERLRAQNDYLEAMERNDYAQMEAIRAKYSGRRPTDRSQSMTPATFETPGSNFGSETPRSTTSTSTKKSTQAEAPSKTIAEKHSLDSFLQNYTSEDNQSFQEIIDTAEQKLKQKFAILYKEEHMSAIKMAKALALPNIEKQFEQSDALRQIDTWTYKNMNSVMYIPEGVPLTEQETIDAINKKQTIQHNATRLSCSPFASKNTDQGNKTQCPEQNSLTELNKLQLSANGAPHIRGFDLIKTPSPRPGDAFSPLMTWGEIEGTPFRLDGGDTPLVRSNSGPSFKINENSRRENIGLALAEKVGEKMRAQKAKAMNMARKNIGSPFLRSNMERLASMSPAARRLATNKLGLKSPMLTPSSTRTLLVTPSLKKTPIVQSKKHASKDSTPNQLLNIADHSSNDAKTKHLTDDLLKIPTKRLKASDFF